MFQSRVKGTRVRKRKRKRKRERKRDAAIKTLSFHFCCGVKHIGCNAV